MSTEEYKMNQLYQIKSISLQNYPNELSKGKIVTKLLVTIGFIN